MEQPPTESSQFEDTLVRPLEVVSKSRRRTPLLKAILVSSIMFLLLVAGAIGYFLGMRSRQPIVAVISTPTPTPTVSPPTTVTQSPTPSPSPTPLSYPAGWKEHVFTAVDVKLAAPANWKSDFQTFSTSSLIRFWQGGKPDTATIQLTIKPDWSNTGDAQYLPRNFEISSDLKAAKVDPPKLEDEKLDRYQTNYYFQTDNAVYVLNCVHNWISEQYQLCETMLRTGVFK